MVLSKDYLRVIFYNEFLDNFIVVYNYCTIDLPHFKFRGITYKGSWY